MKKTKIVATMSDFRCTEEFVKQLFDAGMDVVRVNSAHVSEDGATHIVETVHRVNPAIPIMIDTKGPEIRVTTIADEYGNSINFRPGDRVAVRVERKAARGRRNIRRDRFSSPDAGMKARVEEVTERARSRWLGVFRTGKNKPGRVLGDGVSSPSSIELAEKPAMEVLPGQLVSVEPITCGEEKKAPRGKIVEVLGYPDEPHVDMEAVIRKYGLSVEFPASVLRELETLPQTPSPGELARREDWTDRTVITIDPASAKDFDDAISITATPSGWTLAVHIADVSHFVKPGGSLDGEALRRGNSTYLPDRVLPMLPPRLSDDLCSLRPDVVRLTKVCEMKFDKKGKMLRARFADAFIRSKARLTYQEAFGMLKGNDKGEVPSTVREAWNLASILRRNRYAKGALDLDFPEVRAVMDKDGRVTGIITEEYDESHQLIEECMRQRSRGPGPEKREPSHHLPCPRRTGFRQTF